MTLTIRRGEPRDAGVIAEFNRRMAWETEHKHLDPDTLARGVARVFTDPARGFYLVAEAEGEVVGQLPDGLGERRRLGQQGRDVLEQDAGVREVRDVPDVIGKLHGS